jgi:hypothetical protein
MSLFPMGLRHSHIVGEGQGEGAKKIDTISSPPTQQFILIELNPNENIRFVVKPQETIKEGQTIALQTNNRN